MEDSKTLEIGASGKAVGKLHNALSALGYQVELVAEDEFRTATEDAVKEFQRDHGLKVDGVVGPKTAEHIERALHKLVKVPRLDHLRLLRIQEEITSRLQDMADVVGKVANPLIIKNPVRQFTVTSTGNAGARQLELRLDTGETCVKYIDPPGICEPCSAIVTLRASTFRGEP